MPDRYLIIISETAIPGELSQMYIPGECGFGRLLEITKLLAIFATENDGMG